MTIDDTCDDGKASGETTGDQSGGSQDNSDGSSCADGPTCADGSTTANQPAFSVGELDAELLKKYDVAGPRYTSYPTAPNFNPAFGEEEYSREASRTSANSIAPLSLYVHIPFCENICYYCACNKIISSDHSVSRRYLDALGMEIARQGALFGKRRPVTQLHFGGGTPTFLDGAELTELMHLLASNFNLIDADEREYSIEIDPRTVDKDSVALLKGLGFNRLSLGVQDFNPQVQAAINRSQDFLMVQQLMETARLHRFKSISFDLIYGLPLQTLETLEESLKQVMELQPDRVAFYNYAHLPERFKSQRAIARHDLPSAQQKLDMIALIGRLFAEQGYAYIGMDHFARPEDELFLARQQGRLQRNFQGYSTCLAKDLVGLGVSAISSLEHCYAQNAKDLGAYYQQVEEGRLAIDRGLLLSPDDELRRDVISQLICSLQVDINSTELRFDCYFSEYFAQELAALKFMEKDGLVQVGSDKIRVTERGRMMLRNICMPFDRYLKDSSGGQVSSTQKPQYSKVL